MKKFLTAALAAALCIGTLSACGSGAAPAADPAESSSGAPASESTPAPSEQEAPVPESTGDEEPVAATMGDPDKKVILVVSFGTSYNDTRAVTIEAIESDIATAFPEYEVRRAFTSQIIIDKLKERDGLEIDNVDQAMERLVADGVGTLVVQPTHVMHGAEYDDMMAEISPYGDHFASLSYGRTLLSTTEDYEKVVNAIMGEYAPAEDTALVLMGHGTHHFANSTYAALDYMFKDMGHANVFVGTVEGYPEFESVSKWVDAGGYNKVVMAPLMVVAGDHASNDMAGDEDDSWKVMFKSQGKEVEPVLKGLGEIAAVRAIYVEHVTTAINGEAE